LVCDSLVLALGEENMSRLAVLLWLMGGTVLAGVFVMIVLMSPDLQVQAMRWIPIGAGVGYVIGIPLAFIVARPIAKTTTREGGISGAGDGART
jgi:hypothetical protein